MIYSRWSCYNYGPYYGEHSIDLVNNLEDKNIILVRGLNGYGKTSFINGIILALYGEKSNLHKNVEYKHFLKEKINDKALNEGKRNAWIAIEFIDNTYSDINRNKYILVKRELNLIADDFANDYITIAEDGRELDLSNEETEKYLEKIIPKEILQFFAFDAEQIRYTADDSNINDDLTRDIAKILDITKYEIAQDKIKAYQNKCRSISNRVSSTKVAEMHLNVQQLKENIDNVKYIIRMLDDEIESLNDKSEKIERWLKGSGYIDSNKRSEYELKIDELKEKKDAIVESFIEENANILPYLVLLNEIKTLKNTLLIEQSVSIKDTNDNNLLNVIDEMVSVLYSKEIIPPLSDIQISKIRELTSLKITNTLNQYNRNDKLLHINTISKNEFDSIIDEVDKLIDQCNIQAVKYMYDINELERIDYEIKKGCNILNTLPSKKQFNEQEELYEEIKSQLENKNNVRKNEINKNISLEEELSKQEIKLSKLEKELEETTRTKRCLDIALRVQNVLSEYSQLLKQHKTKDINKYMKDMLGMLCHKNKMISDIEVDEKTFEVILKDEQNNTLHKRRLSEGEKQIYGLSLTYALAKASKKELGFIIDTPFAKLDSIHKQNVIERFIPNIGRQVIILAQDEEINGEKLEILRNHCTCEYELITNEENNSHFILRDESEGAIV